MSKTNITDAEKKNWWATKVSYKVVENYSLEMLQAIARDYIFNEFHKNPKTYQAEVGEIMVEILETNEPLYGREELDLASVA
jgi:hypothetical protein